MLYGDFKNLPRRTASEQVLLNKVFDIAKNPKYDGYKRGIASMTYWFFDKKSASLARSKTASGGVVKSGIMSNQELAEVLHKLIIIKFEKQKVHSIIQVLILQIWN